MKQINLHAGRISARLLQAIFVTIFSCQLTHSQCEKYFLNIPDGYHSIPWNSTIDFVKKTFPKIMRMNQDNGEVESYFNPDWSNYVEFFIIKGKGLQAVYDYSQDPQKYLAALEATKKEYGPPSKTVNSQNVLIDDKSLEQSIAIWYGHKTDIKAKSILTEQSKNVGSYISFLNPQYRYHFNFESESMMHIKQIGTKNFDSDFDFGKAYSNCEWGMSSEQLTTEYPALKMNRVSKDIVQFTDADRPDQATRIFTFCSDRLVAVEVSYSHRQALSFFGNYRQVLRSQLNTGYGNPIYPLTIPSSPETKTSHGLYIEPFPFAGNDNTDFEVEFQTKLQNLASEKQDAMDFDIVILIYKSKSFKSQ